MPIHPNWFEPFHSDGLIISQDSAANQKIIEIASEVLHLQREGTHTELHLSDILGCSRKGQFNVDGANSLIALGQSIPARILSEAQVVYFAMGYNFQGFLLGQKPEKPRLITRPTEFGDVKFWVSPDGEDLWPNAPINEVKSTTRSPRKAEHHLGGRGNAGRDIYIEEVLHDANPYWFDYILASMHILDKQEYNLSVAWMLGGQALNPEGYPLSEKNGGLYRSHVGVYTFNVQATEERIMKTWDRRMQPQLEAIALAQSEDKTIPLNPFQVMAYCNTCEYRGTEPCKTEIDDWVREHPEDGPR